MTIHAQIQTALAGLGVAVYPDAAPQEKQLPVVIYRRTVSNPVNTLQGYAGITNSVFIFECYSKRETEALQIASDLATAIEASSIQTKTRQTSAGEDFEPVSDAFMEPVTFSFWHP